MRSLRYGARGLHASRPSLAATSVPIADLHKAATDAVLAQGYSRPEADVLLDVMMWAQLRNNEHGVTMIANGGITRSPLSAPVRSEYDTKLSARLDGQQQHGILVMHEATATAIDKAKKHGVGLVGTKNTSSSAGAPGYYLDTIAQAGLVGLVFGQTPELVAPYGANSKALGANPMGISVPSPRGPIVLDMETAACSVLGLQEAQRTGSQLPAGMAYDSAGRPTTDPVAALSGALRVFDESYKGGHLAVMVELLAGPLVGAAVESKASADNWGNLVLAFDPELLGEKVAFMNDVETVLRRVKGSAPNAGVAEIMLPGERESRTLHANLQAGNVTVEDSLLNKLRAMAGGQSPGAGREASSAFGLATRLCHPAGKGKGDPYKASSPVLYQTATFELPSVTEGGEYDYTRSGNPTRDQLQDQMADLEGADRAFAFTSGMLALDVAMRLVEAGGHIVTGDDIYGGTSRLLSRVAPQQGISVTNVDMNDLGAVQRAITPATKLVWMESPTNPRMQVVDIAAIASIARAAGAISLVDNSIMAPVFQQPLGLGVDICMTSATKFIAGHSDVTAGILSVRGQELADKVYFLQNSAGGGLAPYDCWLALRGLKTMSLRMERQQENCMAMARWLEAHPLVTKVNYPGLPSDPGYALQMRQALGSGSLCSFETGNVALSLALAEHAKLFKVTVSFGSTTSLISLPCFMSHASIPADVRKARGLPDDLVRISAGIESEQDLIADLEQAMSKAADECGIRLPSANRQFMHAGSAFSYGR